MAKGYIEKSTITNTKNGEVKVYFRGIDDYVQDDAKYCEPYKLRKALVNRIKRDIDFAVRFLKGEKINDSKYSESDGTYIIEVEIIEVELEGEN